MPANEYLDEVANRLRADGADVTSQNFRGLEVLVGHRARFRLQWAATKLHLFTTVVTLPQVTPPDLDRFTTDALEYAKAEKGRFRGFQSGVAAIAAVVTEHADPAAAEYARTQIAKGFGAFAWPVVVDLGTRTVHSHEGRVIVGGIYAAYLRRQIAATLPTP